MDVPDPGSVLDMDVVDSLRGLEGDGGESLFEELVALFVADAARLVGEIEAALEAGDARRLERCAHTLKSSSASLGAAAMSTLCFELEKRGRERELPGAEELVRQTRESYRQACLALEALRA